MRSYLSEHTNRPDQVLTDLAAETATLGPSAGMQVPAEEGALLTLLTSAVGARQAVEVGTFTGYSALCIARALPADGRLLCLDVSDEWTSIARRYWERAGVADRVELRLGPAADTLAALPPDPVFDIAFIDADKTSYPAYYELLLPRLRPGGLLVVDNVLLNGSVLAMGARHPNTLAMRAFNTALAADPRVRVVMLPLADGVTIAQKLPTAVGTDPVGEPAGEPAAASVVVTA
jgi:caffeoyl-CoA O-methyltransferase